MSGLEYVVKKNQSTLTVIVLHGFASSIASVEKQFSRYLCGLGHSIIILQGSHKCSGMFEEFSWFPVTSNYQVIRSNLERVTPCVAEKIKDIISKENLGKRLIIIGHSQGAIVGLDIFAKSLLQIEKVIAISSFFVNDESYVRKKRNKGKVYLIHGENDQMISRERVLLSHLWLLDLGIKSKYKFIENHGHDLTLHIIKIALRYCY